MVLPPRGRAPSNAAVKSDASRQPLRTSGYAPCRVRLADPRREYLVMFTRPTRLSGRIDEPSSRVARSFPLEAIATKKLPRWLLLICHEEYLTTSRSPRAFSTLHYVTWRSRVTPNAIRRGELWGSGYQVWLPDYRRSSAAIYAYFPRDSSDFPLVNSDPEIAREKHRVRNERGTITILSTDALCDLTQFRSLEFVLSRNVMFDNKYYQSQIRRSRVLPHRHSITCDTLLTWVNARLFSPFVYVTYDVRNSIVGFFCPPESSVLSHFVPWAIARVYDGSFLPEKSAVWSRCATRRSSKCWFCQPRAR